jgi:hypothetical protein
VSPPPAQAILYLVTRILDGLEQAIDDGKGFRAAFEKATELGIQFASVGCRRSLTDDKLRISSPITAPD